MIIYRDLISHDEMFSDIYKIREIAGGLCLEVEGKMVSRTEGNIDDSLIGGNASAEGPEGEGTQSTVITGVDIVMNHHLQETSFTKEAYKKYIKDYMKSIKGKLEEQRPERVKPFMTERKSTPKEGGEPGQSNVLGERSCRQTGGQQCGCARWCQAVPGTSSPRSQSVRSILPSFSAWKSKSNGFRVEVLNLGDIKALTRFFRLYLACLMSGFSTWYLSVSPTSATSSQPHLPPSLE
uniref:Translationally-controlled tumor protein n=1 Tax=Oryctolagus cuniculus TaxID=9986 RepID=A0A5F9DM88_RABIT